MSHSVEVSIMGRNFNIRTDDDPAHVLAAASLVQEQVDNIRQMGGVVAPDRLMSLVALNLAGELMKKSEGVVEDFQSLLSELDEVISQADGLAKAPLR